MLAYSIRVTTSRTPTSPMLEVATLHDEPSIWPKPIDWRALADHAVAAAFAETDYAAAASTNVPVEISVRFTSDEEVRILNRDYRGKDKATNVLSFPMADPDLIATTADGDDIEILLGDIVLAEGVCAREAAERGISIEDHAAHLLVHGTLHLLGFDHVGDEEEAEAMEAIERRALARLGLADPYALPHGA
jgi:probable rRNA maturation factor